MRVGIGYCDHPDSQIAGTRAVQEAQKQAGRTDACDIVLLFNTASHNSHMLRSAVSRVVGENVPIYGGGTVGVITNDIFGYAGNQVGIACFWLDSAVCNVVKQDGLGHGEGDTGMSLGKKLLQQGVSEETPVMMFYDAVKKESQGGGLFMATWLLEGLKEGLGFFPNLVGAGMQGDHICTPAKQYLGDVIDEQSVMALTFSGEIQMDTAILHGCRPASEYYTVTKADGPVILEINHEPAISFIQQKLGDAITPKQYPFFLMFGINHGERWGEYDEDNYASRLCLGVDPERSGIVMFEPDMVEGTQFQLMFRTLDLDYMKPKIEKVFEQLGDREPVFAVYIDCAGRCAGYGGNELEDAVILQQTVGNRVPLLGLYTGVEIARIGGRPRGLDWTGVFCLFSQGKGEKQTAPRLQQHESVWENKEKSVSDKMPIEAVTRLNEQNIAKILSLDTQLIAVRHELEQKRRGGQLFAELSESLRMGTSNENIFITVTRRLNAALNMQRTAVLIPKGEDGAFIPLVLQGYTSEEKARIARAAIPISPELLDKKQMTLVNGADDESRLAELREVLKLPYFVASTIVVQNEIAALLFTGRVTEQMPYLSRLGKGDAESVQSICTLLESVLLNRRLEREEERSHMMLNAMPLSCAFWDENGTPTDCNEEILRLFGVESKEEYLENIFNYAPELQPDGTNSVEGAKARILQTFVTGSMEYEWMFRSKSGELIPSLVRLTRLPHGEGYTVAGYIRDMREQKAVIEEFAQVQELIEKNSRAKSEFMAAVSHEIRTPLNAVTNMASAIADASVDESLKVAVEQGLQATKHLTTALDSIIDYSSIENGQTTLNMQTFALSDMVMRLNTVAMAAAQEKSLTFRIEADSDLELYVVGDQEKLEQALRHIIVNACKYTSEGEVVFRLHYERSSLLEKVRIFFEIEDTGCGISEEDQSKLFVPFALMNTSYSRSESGMGMGLAVSRSIIRLMGGDIQCQSELGKGSIFKVFVLLDAGVKEKELSEVKEEQEDFAGLRVLVVEDNSINQMIVAGILAQKGVEVRLAENGLAALAALDEQVFDLVFMDIQMPEMDGLTATEQIRKNPEYDDMPILALTAHTGAIHKEECMRCGMNAHLAKPVDAEEIYQALEKWGKRR